jgi:hypothetical protein
VGIGNQQVGEQMVERLDDPRAGNEIRDDLSR